MTELASKATAPFSADDAGESAAPTTQTLPWLAVWAILLTLASLGTAITAFAQHQHDSAPVTGQFVPVIALLVCLIAAGYDAASGRIPNQITYTAVLLGLGINSLAALLAWMGHDPIGWLGNVGFAQAFTGFGVCAVIGIGCLLLAGMGGGDVKLLVAMGALLGFTQVTHLMLWTLLIAVPYSLVNLVISGRLNGVIRTAALQLMQIVYLRQLEPISPPSKTRIPLAVPVLVAMFAVRWMPLTQWMGGF